MPTLKVRPCETAVKPAHIPDHRRDTIARQTLAAVERFFSIPGVQEDYEKWLVEYNQRKAAAEKASKA